MNAMLPLGLAPVSTADMSPCGLYRWRLTRAWAAGPRVCWIGLNPSTADGESDDPTIRRMMGFSRAWGYGGMEVVNLYPFRATDPAKMRKWADWERNGPDWYARDAIHFGNLPAVVRSAKSCQLVIASWGSGAPDPEFADHLIEEIETGEEPWPVIHCLGVTKSGQPKHPLYLRGDLLPLPMPREGV